MHLMKRILPFVVQQALIGRTWAGKAVFDSPDDIGSIRVDGERGLFVAVYCDEWDLKDPFEPGEGSQQVGHGAFKLVIEVGAAKQLEVMEGDERRVETRLAATDVGLEWQIAFISRQCSDALTSNASANPWARVWQSFIAGDLKNFGIRRGGPEVKPNQQAPRYASCVTILKVGTLGEPVRGNRITAETYPAFHQLLTLMEASDAIEDSVQGQWGDLAKIIRAHIEPVDGIEASIANVAQQRTWFSAETISAIGLADFNDLKLSGMQDARPVSEPVRTDVPLDTSDAAEWLKAQGPDEEQGPGYGG